MGDELVPLVVPVVKVATGLVTLYSGTQAIVGSSGAAILQSLGLTYLEFATAALTVPTFQGFIVFVLATGLIAGGMYCIFKLTLAGMDKLESCFKLWVRCHYGNGDGNKDGCCHED